jgi:hypothetical protein
MVHHLRNGSMLPHISLTSFTDITPISISSPALPLSILEDDTSKDYKKQNEPFYEIVPEFSK